MKNRCKPKTRFLIKAKRKRLLRDMCQKLSGWRRGVVSTVSNFPFSLSNPLLESFILLWKLRIRTIDPDVSSQRDRGVTFRDFTAKP